MSMCEKALAFRMDLLHDVAMSTEHMFDTSILRPRLQPPSARRTGSARPSTTPATTARTSDPKFEPGDPDPGGGGRTAGPGRARSVRSPKAAFAKPTAEIDPLYRLAVQAERDVGRMRVVQVQAVRAIELATSETRAPGQLEWWIVDRLGLTPTVAHDLVCAARSMSDDRLDEVRTGSITFDRALAETRALVSGAEEEHVRASRPRMRVMADSERPSELPALPPPPAA